MTSLMEASELPTTPLAGVANFAIKEPLLSDLTLASVLTTALEAIPSLLSESLPAANGIARHLTAIRASSPVLSAVPWLRRLEQQDGNALVLDRRGLTARGGLLPDDHLFKSMARKGLIRDNRVVWASRYVTLPPATLPTKPPSATASASASAPALTSTISTTSTSTTSTSASVYDTPTTPTVFNVYALSGAVCGHAGVVHGGLSSAILDETFGYLLYLLSAAVSAAVQEATLRGRQQQQQEQEGASCSGVMEALADVDLRSAMTAHLEVDFLKPLPSDCVVVCVAQVERIEGRKVWLQAQLRSRPPALASPPVASSSASRLGGSGSSSSSNSGSDASKADGGVVYAKGKALFVTPRPRSGNLVDVNMRSSGLGAGAQSDGACQKG